MSVKKVASGFSVTSLSLACVFSLSSTCVREPAIAAPQAKAPAKVAAPAQQKRPASVNNSAALTAYWNRLRVRLQNNWQVPDGKNTVVLTANVAADGSSSDIVAEGHPKDPQAEVSAAEAFNKSLPLEALPQGVASAKITVNFEYQYDPHGDGYSKVSGQISQTSAPAAAQTSTGAAAQEGAKF
ncbi:MAG: hypothetical protein IT342_23800 [Candidatus Melainabacteria bacterium]|nr:hypothetical protein [Candidatus Melainabacteria bacterium]